MDHALKLAQPGQAGVYSAAHAMSLFFRSTMKYPRRSVFISYNHTTASDIAGRIYDRLCHKLGPETVFKDNEEPELGVDFRDSFKAALSDCRVMLVVIDPGWYERRNEPRPLGDDVPPDWVRMEVEYGLEKSGLKVIPVLVNDAPKPENQALPPTLGPLRLRYFKRVHSDDGFKSSADALAGAIEKHLVPPQKSGRKMLMSAAAALLLAGGAIYGTHTKWMEWLHRSPVDSGPSFHLFDMNGDPVGQRSLQATRVPEGKTTFEGHPYPCKNGLQFTMQLEDSKTPLVAPIVINYSLKSKESSASAASLHVDSSAHLLPVTDPELKSKGYSLSGGWNILPEGSPTLMPMQKLPFTPLFYAGAEGRIPAGTHDIALTITSGKTTVYTGEIKVEAWELEPQDERVKVLSPFGKDIRDPSTVIATTHSNNLETLHDGLTGVGFDFGLKIENTSDTPIPVMTGGIYARARSSANDAVTKNYRMSVAPESGINTAPRTGGYNVNGDEWGIAPKGGLQPHTQTEAWIFHMNLGRGGDVQSGDHELGIEILDGGKSIYRGRLKVHVD